MSGSFSFFITLLSAAATAEEEVVRAQFGSIGWFEIMIISLIIILLFGARKLPDIGRGLGKAIANFKRGIRESPRKIDESNDEEAKQEEGEKKEESKKE